MIQDVNNCKTALRLNERPASQMFQFDMNGFLQACIHPNCLLCPEPGPFYLKGLTHVFLMPQPPKSLTWTEKSTFSPQMTESSSRLWSTVNSPDLRKIWNNQRRAPVAMTRLIIQVRLSAFCLPVHRKESAAILGLNRKLLLANE